MHDTVSILISDDSLKDLNVIFGILSVLATSIVAYGLYKEYEPGSFRVFRLFRSRTDIKLTPGKLVYRSRNIGPLLVTTGVALEFAFGLIAFTAGNKLDNRRQARILELQQDQQHLIDDNAQLEKALKARHIDDVIKQLVGHTAVVDSEAFDKIERQYTDVSVTIQFVPDIEALRLANDFLRLAHRESWKVRAANTNAAGVPMLEIDDGITIYTWEPTPRYAGWNMLAGFSRPTTPDEQAYVAGDKLAAFVRSLDIDVVHLGFEFAKKFGMLTTFDRKPGDICILIGMRPIENTLRDLEWDAEKREFLKQQKQTRRVP